MKSILSLLFLLGLSANIAAQSDSIPSYQTLIQTTESDVQNELTIPGEVNGVISKEQFKRPLPLTSQNQGETVVSFAIQIIHEDTTFFAHVEGESIPASIRKQLLRLPNGTSLIFKEGIARDENGNYHPLQPITVTVQ